MHAILPPIEPIKTTLEYLQNFLSKPVSYMLAPPGGHTWETGEYVPMPVTIRDCRTQNPSPTLDCEGFQLYSAPSTLREFGDTQKIKRVYYAEMREVILAASGAREAVVLDHVVRRHSPKKLKFLDGHAEYRASAAMRVRCDFTPASARQGLMTALAACGIQCTQRFSIVNVFRSAGISDTDAPLALCDARTVHPTDLIASDIIYPTSRNEIFDVVYNPAHIWSYFDAVTSDEVILVKQYDSSDIAARYTPRAQFANSALPVEMSPRESIEVRCVLIYE